MLSTAFMEPIIFTIFPPRYILESGRTRFGNILLVIVYPAVFATVVKKQRLYTKKKNKYEIPYWVYESKPWGIFGPTACHKDFTMWLVSDLPLNSVLLC